MSTNQPRIDELTLQGSVRVASDIHLSPKIPLTCLAFYDFVQDCSAHTDHLILAGDIFEHWIGDDAATRNPPSWLQEAIQHLQDFASHKKLYLMTGNRDFLLGRRFADLVNAELLPCEVLLNCDAGQFYLCHGDQFCTHERGFMFFRAISHNQLLRELFLVLPLKFRKYVGRRARERSIQKGHSNKRYDGVTADAVDKAFRHFSQARYMIHGHTHCPGKYMHQLDDDTARTRLVLSDWDFDHNQNKRADYLELSADGIARHGWPDTGLRIIY